MMPPSEQEFDPMSMETGMMSSSEQEFQPTMEIGMGPMSGQEFDSTMETGMMPQAGIMSNPGFEPIPLTADSTMFDPFENTEMGSSMTGQETFGVPASNSVTTLEQAPTNTDLNQQLLHAKQEWWAGRANMDSIRMSKAAHLGSILKQQGATETDEMRQLDQMNKQVFTAKQKYWCALAKCDTAGMAEAEREVNYARLHGATIKNETRMDQLYKKLYDAKVACGEAQTNGTSDHEALKSCCLRIQCAQSGRG